MAKSDDQKLYDYTMKMMGNIANYYTTTDMHINADIRSFIEHGVARKIAAILPDKYTEVEVLVAEFDDHYMVSAAFSIDGGCEMVAIHEEEIPEKAPSMMKAPIQLGTSSRGTGEPIKERLAAFKERLKKMDTEEKEYPQYDENGHYDPRCRTEDFIFPNFAAGRGSKVETLPGGEGLSELSDIEYFTERLWAGLKLPSPPTDSHPMTAKTPVGSEKPTIDFKSISQLSPPTTDGLPRYETGIHVGIDLAKVDVLDQRVEQMAKHVAKSIDDAIVRDLETMMCTTTTTEPEEALTIEKLEEVMDEIAWDVPTSGWSQEYTNWAFENKTSQLTHDDEESKEISWYNPFGAGADWFKTAGLPTSTMEEISFTEEDLDELIDLLDNNKPIVMEFA